VKGLANDLHLKERPLHWDRKMANGLLGKENLGEKGFKGHKAKVNRRKDGWEERKRAI
jgi:hypothetical protein